MPALEQDTRLVMTILFVGTVSGANVFFYAEYGVNFPYSHFEHALLFGLITVGGIMPTGKGNKEMKVFVQN